MENILHNGNDYDAFNYTSKKHCCLPWELTYSDKAAMCVLHLKVTRYVLIIDTQMHNFKHFTSGSLK